MKRALFWACLLLAASCGRESARRPAAAGADSAGAAGLAGLGTDSLMRIVLPAASVALGVTDLAPRADSILAANGFTLDQYEVTMYRIAADTAASRFFESALGR